MLLAIDVGYTNVALGVFEGHELKSTWRVATDLHKMPDEYSLPKEAADALKQELGVAVTPQGAERYSPGKVAARNLAKKWRELFEHTRQAFLDHVETQVPHAHKAVRIKKLARASDAFESRGNYVAMAAMLEKIAREMGGTFTNRREVTGKERGPIQYEKVSDMTDEQIDAELERLWGIASGDEPVTEKPTEH